MSIVSPAETIKDAILGDDDDSSRIEEAFARAGDQFGRGHAIFQGLSQALASLSAELSGAQSEGTSEALHDIADRLNGLAQALPAETALLDGLGNAASEASGLLKPLFKHIHTISIIARSAKIEAASLAEDREGFSAFTQEAYALANAVQLSLQACARDQELLSKAVASAFEQQKAFEHRYGEQLRSEGRDLISAYSEMQSQRDKSVHLAEFAGTSARKIAEAVGRSIMALQAGDIARQRLEHVSHGLRLVDGAVPGLVPEQGSAVPDRGLICRLQSMQLKDAEQELQHDVNSILQALSAILADAAGVVGQARSLYGSGSNDTSSFLARIRQILAQASELIATCESAGKSVDGALVLVEETLGKFRETIAGLSEAVVDITLIGMNASLKAGHLGTKGNAFRVIANELKATADLVSAGAARLKPTLERIETSASELRSLRIHGDTMQLARLEPQVLHALREIEAGNERLGGLMSRLIGEGAEFEELMNSAANRMTMLGEGAAALPHAAKRLEAIGADAQTSTLAPADRAMFDELFACYTMERERDVHRKVFGDNAPSAAVPPAMEDADDGVLLF